MTLLHQLPYWYAWYGSPACIIAKGCLFLASEFRWVLVPKLGTVCPLPWRMSSSSKNQNFLTHKTTLPRSMAAILKLTFCVCVDRLKRRKTCTRHGHTVSITYPVQRSYGPGWDISAWPALTYLLSTSGFKLLPSCCVDESCCFYS